MTEFFWSIDESEKCFRQIAHIICNCFSFSNAQYYVNAIIVECLISKSFYYSRQYKITMANWLALDNNTSRILEITYTWLVTSNAHYWSFDKFIKGPPHFEDFKVLVVEVLPSTKVVETSASSSPANGSSSSFFGFVKCFSCFGSVKRPSFLIKIKKSSQSLADGVICLFSSNISFADNGNGKQFQFNYIFWFDSSFGQLLIPCDTVKDSMSVFWVGLVDKGNGEPLHFYYIF